MSGRELDVFVADQMIEVDRTTRLRIDRHRDQITGRPRVLLRSQQRHRLALRQTEVTIGDRTIAAVDEEEVDGNAARDISIGDADARVLCGRRGGARSIDVEDQHAARFLIARLGETSEREPWYGTRTIDRRAGVDGGRRAAGEAGRRGDAQLRAARCSIGHLDLIGNGRSLFRGERARPGDSRGTDDRAGADRRRASAGQCEQLCGQRGGRRPNLRSTAWVGDFERDVERIAGPGATERSADRVG